VSGVTSIEWTERTWNPVTGCDRVSSGCAHCYALTLAGRLRAMGNPRYQRNGHERTSGPGFQLTTHEDLLGLPTTWRRPGLVFVNSMSDLFHPDVPLAFIERVFETMAGTSRHTYQVLTKRHERLAELAPRLPWPSNVWMGVSIENRRFVHRADHLRQVPAAVRFISAEPLLGPSRGPGPGGDRLADRGRRERSPGAPPRAGLGARPHRRRPRRRRRDLHQAAREGLGRSGEGR
jgi:protein gp37